MMATQRDHKVDRVRSVLKITRNLRHVDPGNDRVRDAIQEAIGSNDRKCLRALVRALQVSGYTREFHAPEVAPEGLVNCWIRGGQDWVEKVWIFKDREAFDALHVDLIPAPYTPPLSMYDCTGRWTTRDPIIQEMPDGRIWVTQMETQDV